MEKTFSIVTIGCKLNQFDSELMRETLVRRGWTYRRPEETARFCIINSCTVTGKSDARSRSAVRRARRRAPGSFIVVTGCYAETQPERLRGMEEVDLVFGNEEKRSAAAILETIAAGQGLRGADTITAVESDDRPIERFLDHSRAFVKIQEGCNASCSYCIVPRARGPSRSVPSDAVLRQVRVLREHGYHEIVLTGIHIGRYGADLDPPQSLAALVELILRATGDLRVRLSSIESTEVTPPLAALVTGEPRVAPHLHIPLQSGDDAILEAMNRPYRTLQFRRAIEMVARANDRCAIGTDIMVGFPAETEERFANTFALVRELPLSHFHVFSFSPRPGTPAATMHGQVSPDAKKRRSSLLIELGAAKHESFLKRQVETVQTGLIEGPGGRGSPLVRCLTGNYCNVFVRGAGDRRAGTLAPIRVTRYARGNLYGAFLTDAGRRLIDSEEGSV